MTKGKGKNFSTLQVERLLDAVQDVLPLGAQHWEKVALIYNNNRPVEIPERDATSLKRKFKALKSVKKPTGDPDCPPDVKRAKRLSFEIEKRASVRCLEDAFDANGFPHGASGGDDEEEGEREEDGGEEEEGDEEEEDDEEEEGEEGNEDENHDCEGDIRAQDQELGGNGVVGTPPVDSAPVAAGQMAKPPRKRRVSKNDRYADEGR